VSLRPAVKRNEVSFSLLDRRDFSPVGYRHYNKSTGEEVSWEQIVRGYEYEKDEYVVLSDEEIKHAAAKPTETIEIVEFVERDDIPPMFFDTPYFVEPLKKKSYSLLREALERANKVGIARLVLRTREHVAALLVRDSVLMLELLRYQDELAEPTEVEAPSKSAKGTRASELEVKMAEKLIAGMSGKWEPSQFRNEYREDVLALVEKKVKAGQTHEIVEPRKESEPRAPREVVDLMPLLKKSLGQAGRAGARRSGGERWPSKRTAASGTSAARRSPRAGAQRSQRADARRARKAG
jgi:DNA end-binding protein Ku